MWCQLSVIIQFSMRHITLTLEYSVSLEKLREQKLKSRFDLIFSRAIIFIHILLFYALSYSWMSRALLQQHHAVFQRFSRSRKIISEFLELARQRFAIQVDFRSLPFCFFLVFEIAAVNDVKHRLLYTEMNKFKRDKSLAIAVLTPIR